jgi:ribulose-5-phosphate 4-epimerase/fuculose-1-phosphate aldolase
LINPFGLRYDEITASNLIKIDVDGNKLSDSPWPVNKAGYVIHSTVHQARSDLHCIIHTHEPISQSLCATTSPAIPVTQEGCQFYERVGYHDFKGIVLDGSEGPLIVEALGQKKPYFGNAKSWNDNRRPELCLGFCSSLSFYKKYGSSIICNGYWLSESN